VWTPEIDQDVTGADMTSSFTVTSCDAICSTGDGSVVVKVSGYQVLSLPSQPPHTKQVSLEYLVTKTPKGLRISGISESGTSAR